MSKQILRLLIALYSLLCLNFGLAAQTSPLYKTTLQLQWKHQFEFAGFYAAIHKGFYAQRGLQVELREYQEGMDVIEEVLSGRTEYGLLHSSLVQARLEGKPVKLLANYFKRLPLAILTTPEITQLADLRGKRLMVSAKDLKSPLFKLAFEVEQLEVGQDLRIVPHSFNAQPFLVGEVDAMTAFVTDEPFELEQHGFAFNTLDLSDYMRSLGDLYLFTSEQITAQHPHITQAFIEASNEGWRYALAHKEEIVDLILTQYSQRKSREALLYEAEKTHDMVLPIPLAIGAVYEPLIKDVSELIMRQEGIEAQGYLQNFIFNTVQHRSNLELTTNEHVWLEMHPRIVLGVDDHYPPFNYQGNTGQMLGITLDYVELIEQKLGFSLELMAAPWAEVYPKAMAHEIDGILNARITAERQKRLIFTEGYRKIAYFGVMIPENAKPFAQLADLKNQRLGVKRNTFQANYVKRKNLDIELVEFDTLDEGLLELSKDRLDGVFDDLPVLQHKIQGMLLSGVKLGWAQQVTGREMALGIGVRNTAPQLASILNKAIRAIDEDEHQKIFQHWTRFSAAEFAKAKPLFLTPAEQAWLKAHPIIRLASDSTWMPVESINAHGEFQGISADYAKLIEQRLGIHFQTSPAKPWDEIVDMIEKRQLDLFSAAMATDSQKKHTLFTQPYLSQPMVIITSNQVDYINGIEGLGNKKVALLKGCASTDTVVQQHPHLNSELYDSAESALWAVSQGRVFAFLGNIATSSYEIRSTGIPNVKVSGHTHYNYDLSFGVRNDWPEFLPILQKALDSISEEEKHAILQKWVTVEITPHIDYSLLWETLSIAVLIILIFLYWNRKLSRSQAALQRSEQFIRSTINALDAHLCVLDENGTILMVNHAWREFGLDNEADPNSYAEGINYLSVCDKAQGEQAQEATQVATGLRKILSGDSKEFSMEYSCDAPKIKRCFNVRITCFPRKNHVPLRVLVMHEDITERKRAEEELRIYEHIVDTNQDQMAFINLDYNYHMVNNAYAQIYARSKQSIIGRPIVDLLGLDAFQFSKAYLDQCRQGHSVRYQAEFNNTGELRFLDVAYYPYRSPQGHISGIVASIRDITQLKHVERSLRESEEKYRRLFELSEEPMWMLCDKHFVMANAAAARILEYDSIQQLVDIHFSKISPSTQPNGQASAALADKMIALAYQKGHHRFEWTHQKSNGDLLPVEVSLTCVPYQGKEALFCVWHDLSERKRNESQLRYAKEQAEAANHAKSAFLANMSHELRTPLNAVLGFAQLLQQSSRLNTTDKQYLERIYNGGQYLLTLINDVLDLAKVEAGRIELFPEPINLKFFLLDVVSMFQFRSESKGLHFKYLNHPPFPSCIYADPKRLRQILINLLGNALKFTKQGSIHLSVRYQDHYLQIEVKDTGIGIPAEQHTEIFQAFSQTGEQRYKAQGTGLGLSITQKIVELMNGNIHLDSELGKGSCFTVRLPIKAEFNWQPESTTETQPAMVTGYQHPAGKRRILVVDDTDSNREILSQFLKPLGFSVLEANNGAVCLDLAIQFHPHLVLMDLRMPDMDGLQTTQRLKQIPELALIPVIMVSASTFKEDQEKAQAVGCVNYLGKPIEYPKLLELLQKYLGVQWEYAESEKNNTNNVAQPLTEEERFELKILTDHGAIGEIIDYLRELSQGLDSPNEAKELLGFAEKFKLDEIQKYLETKR